MTTMKDDDDGLHPPAAAGGCSAFDHWSATPQIEFTTARSEHDFRFFVWGNAAAVGETLGFALEFEDGRGWHSISMVADQSRYRQSERDPSMPFWDTWNPAIRGFVAELIACGVTYRDNTEDVRAMVTAMRSQKVVATRWNPWPTITPLSTIVDES